MQLRLPKYGQSTSDLKFFTVYDSGTILLAIFAQLVSVLWQHEHNLQKYYTK